MCSRDGPALCKYLDVSWCILVYVAASHMNTLMIETTPDFESSDISVLYGREINPSQKRQSLVVLNTAS